MMDHVEFTSLYEKHQASVLGFICGSLRKDRGRLAEDIASEAWKRAWEHRDQWTGAASFRTWICTIAMNELRSHMRSLKAIANGGQVQIVSLTRIYSAEHPDTGPMSRVTNRLHAVRQVARLRPGAVKLLSMKYVYGLTDQELADDLNMPLGSVKTRIFRIRERARKQLS